MGLAKLNIQIEDLDCKPLQGCWRTDLVIQLCGPGGAFLVDVWPDIVPQLKLRYSAPASVIEVSDWATITDLGGQTISITTVDTAGASTPHTINLVSPATSPEQVAAQLQGYSDFAADVVDGHVHLETVDRGWSVSMTVGGTAALIWGYPTGSPVTVNGSGYKILGHYYQGAKRVMLQPAPGGRINHIEVDVPAGGYKIWTRCCFGNNEETHMRKVCVRCDEHACVPLMLPAVKLCSGAILHPLMREVVKQEFLLNDDERLAVMRAVAWQANVGKEQILADLAYQRVEAEEEGRGDLVALIDNVILLADKLPQCY